MSAYQMQEMYDMDGMAIPRISPSYHYQLQQHPQQQSHIALNHVPMAGVQATSLPLPLQSQLQISPSGYSPVGRVMHPTTTTTTTPLLTYQSPGQQLQQQPIPATQLVVPQPVIVIDPLSLSLPLLNDRLVKMDYIRKVLGVLFTQIGISFVIINVFNLRTIKDWTQSNLWFLYLVLVVAVLSLILLSCFADTHQDCPINSLLTAMFTVFASLTIGASSTFEFYESSLNLMYFFDMTLFISFALILSLFMYTLQSNYDFNLLNCIRYVVVIVTFFIVIYLILIVIWSNWLATFLPTVAYATTCGLAFILYVITDICFMIQRCLYNSLTPESVMLAVIYLHTDIINPNGNFWGRC